jgi:hypothetical protein
MIFTEEMEVVRDPADTRDLLPRLREQLTAEDIVTYYYAGVGIKTMIAFGRDVGTVRYLVRKTGIDMTLFSIDLLIDHYYQGEDREEAPPPLVRAFNYAMEAAIRLGQVKIVARQYGVET